MVFKFGTSRTHKGKKEINSKFQPCKLGQETILEEYYHFSPVTVASCLLRMWFRIPPGRGCLSVLRVVCCQLEVSATS